MLLGRRRIPGLKPVDWQCRRAGEGCGDREEGEESEEEAGGELEHVDEG